jgi:hypothetical protein
VSSAQTTVSPIELPSLVESGTAIEPVFRPMSHGAWVPSYRQTSWDAIKQGRSGVDSVNCRFVLRVRSELNMQAVERAFAHLINRHDVLRTTLHDIDGRPWLRYGSAMDWHIEHFDVTNIAPAQREEAARQIASTFVWRPLDSGAGPLFKAFVIELDATDYVLGFVVHHMIADGVSVRHLREELLSAYACFARGQSPDPTADQVQYGDYLLTMSDWFEQPATRLLLRRWGAHLTEVPPVMLESAGPSPADAQHGSRRHFEIDPELSVEIERLAQRLRTTCFMVLLTLQAIVLAQLMKRRVVVVGGVVFGREVPALNPMIGYLADRVYWRIDLQGDLCFIEAIERVRQAVLDAMPYAYLRSDVLLAELRRQGYEVTAPVFNFMPTLQQARAASRGTPVRELFELAPPPFVTAVAPGISYWMVLRQTRRGMHGHVRFQRAPIERLIPQFLGTLRWCLANAGRRLSQLTIS